jgi:hypothetical protein
MVVKYFLKFQIELNMKFMIKEVSQLWKFQEILFNTFSNFF